MQFASFADPELSVDPNVVRTFDHILYYASMRSFVSESFVELLAINHHLLLLFPSLPLEILKLVCNVPYKLQYSATLD
jgi:hypothetical protein